MFVIELSLKLSPMPLSVQRKSIEAAQALYAEIRQAMESGNPQLLDLTCEKSEEKQLCLRSSEILSVQLYEKSAMGAGSKRPVSAQATETRSIQLEDFKVLATANAGVGQQRIHALALVTQRFRRLAVGDGLKLS